jgi:Flp pilus assembly protein TadG
VRDEDQRGQAIVMMVVSLVVLLGAAALVIDLGLGWYAKRQLQSSVDAAALAGAQALPSSTNATQKANEYFALNPVRGVTNITKTVGTSCKANIPGCNPVNAVEVRAQGKAATSFARLFGINEMTVGAKATACQPCGTKPLDIMIILDRTGSMTSSTPQKMPFAKQGINTFLGFLDPTSAWVGLTVLPPASTVANRCVTPTSGTKNYNYDNTTAAWMVVPLSQDYKTMGGGLNPNSDLVKTLNCMPSAGTTHYAYAIEKAKAALTTQGRANVQDVIIFLTDGAANTAPSYATQTYKDHPCNTGVTSATAIKSTTWIYSIGYALNADTCDKASGGLEVNPSITPAQALTKIASDPSQYYNRPDAGQLNTIFTAIAADISSGVSKLID